MLKRFDGKHKRGLENIITGGETWTFYYDPENQSNVDAVHASQPTSINQVRRPRSIKKSMLIVFFNHAGIVSKMGLIPRPGRRTLNALFYAKKTV
jgi:hypothetical protein